MTLATTGLEADAAKVLEAFDLYGELDDRRLCDVLRFVVSESRARGARCELAREGKLEVCGTVGEPKRRVWRLKP